MYILLQPGHREDHRPPHSPIGVIYLNSTLQLTYLGCIISTDPWIDKEIDKSLSNLNCSMGTLFKRVLNSHSVKNRTKLLVWGYISTSSTAEKFGSPAAVTKILTSALNSAVSAPSSTFAGVIPSQTWSTGASRDPSFEFMLSKKNLRLAISVSRLEYLPIQKYCHTLRAIHCPQREKSTEIIKNVYINTMLTACHVD